MTEWAEREREIRAKLASPMSPAAHFGWAVAALRDAMAEVKRLQSAAYREQTASVGTKTPKAPKT